MDLCCRLLVTIVSGLVSFFLELMRKEVIDSIHLGVSWLSYKKRPLPYCWPAILQIYAFFSPMKEWMAKKKSSFLLEGKLISAFPCFGGINNYIIIGRHNVRKNMRVNRLEPKFAMNLMIMWLWASSLAYAALFSH